MRQLVSALKAEISLPRYRQNWDTAQKRHPVLKRIADIQAVLRMLRDVKRPDLRHKDILARAIIAEHKSNPGPFWTAVLLLAYSPMLGGLRSRIFGDAFDREDVDQLVLDAFLSVVRGFPLIEKRSFTFLYLKHRTSNKVFRIIRSRQDEIKDHQQLINLAQKLDEFDLFGEIESIETDEDRAEVGTLLMAIAEGEVPKENVELVIETVIFRKKLTEYVAAEYPDSDPGEQERIYQRLKKQRLRSLRRLRELLPEKCRTRAPD